MHLFRGLITYWDSEREYNPSPYPYQETTSRVQPRLPLQFQTITFVHSPSAVIQYNVPQWAWIPNSSAFFLKHSLSVYLVRRDNCNIKRGYSSLFHVQYRRGDHLFYYGELTGGKTKTNLKQQDLPFGLVYVSTHFQKTVVFLMVGTLFSSYCYQSLILDQWTECIIDYYFYLLK